LEEVWPLLQLIIEKQHNKEFEGVRKIISFVIIDIHISISNRITDILSSYQTQSEEERQKIFIATATGIGLDEFWNELTPLANEMGLNCHELLTVYLEFYQSFPPGEAHGIEISTTQIVSLIETIESTLKHSNKPRDNQILSLLLWCLNSLKIPDTPEIFRRIRVLLELCLDSYSKYSYPSLNKFYSTNLVSLFIKLLPYGEQAQEIGLCFFTTLTPEILLKVDEWYIYKNPNKSYPQRLFALNSFLNSEEEVIRIGSAILLSKLRNYSMSVKKLEYIESQELDHIYLDIDWAWSFVNHNDNHRLIGIFLLESSDYPVENVDYQNKLLTTLQQHQTVEESIAWAKLLKEISMPNKKYAIWTGFLEDILAKPWSYNNLVLSAAMERYQSLVSVAGSTIPEAKEKELGLL
jgi:hypothetical protein